MKTKVTLGSVTETRGWLAAMGRAVRSAARPLRFLIPAGLSARLQVLTILFVLLSEILIYLPSIAGERANLLMDRLHAAQLAALAMEAATDQVVAEDLSEELLANAGVLSVVLWRDERKSLFLRPGQLPPQAEARFDLDAEGPFRRLFESFRLLANGSDRIIAVRGVPRLQGGIAIEAVMEIGPIRRELLTYSRNVLALSIVISVLTAGLVFGAMHVLLVRPMQRIQRSMTEFRKAPENATSIIVPSERRDEVGQAERELAELQSDLRAALAQRARLAALGTAVSKINHDLRNMLSSAQLIADRLESSEDPLVQRLAPKLVSAIDRAVKLCTDTMKFGKAEEAPPSPRPFDLRRLADDVGANAVPAETGRVAFRNEVPSEFNIIADPDQLFRVLLNLSRNAVEAVEQSGREGHVSIDARFEDGHAHIELRDTGPGMPARVRERLFEPFTSSQKAGGTGLGLAIAAELVRAHGGQIYLRDTGPEGTVFAVRLPQARNPAVRS